MKRWNGWSSALAVILLASPARLAAAAPGDPPSPTAGPQTPPPAVEAASAPSESSTHLDTAQGAEPVVLSLKGDELPAAAVKQALALELQREVILESEVSPALSRRAAGVMTITYRKAENELAVTWDSKGRTLSRVIAAPPKLDDVVSDSVMLASNLAHDQVPVTEQPAVAVTPAEPAPSPPPPLAARPAPPAAPPELFATASLFYPLATHYRTPEATTHFDLGLIFGRVGAVEGLQVGTVNFVGREHNGHAQGLQLGALGNVVRGDLAALQLAFAANVVTGVANGLQGAFVANVTMGELKGLQASLAFNRAGDVTGVQLGAVNVAGNVDGLQAGVFNVAKKVRGVSVGLINIADDIDGLPLAPISVTKSGGVHPVVWSGTSGYGNVGVKFATRHTYTLFFAAGHHAFNRDFFGGGAAVGGRIPLGAGFNTDIDVSGNWLAAPTLSRDPKDGDEYHEQLVQPRLRMLLSFRVAKHFGLFAGGAITATIRSQRGWDRVTGRLGPELVGGIEL